MRKIILLINSLSSGGAEVFVAQLSAALAKSCKVRVISYAGELDEKGDFLKKYLLSNNVEYISLEATTNFKKIFLPLKLSKIIDKFKPEVVHAHLPRSEQILYLTSFFTRHSFYSVRTKHDDRPYLPFILNSRIDNFFTLNISCSETAYKPFEHLGLAEKSVVVKNGIEIHKSACLKESDTNKLKSFLYLPLDKKIFINIGSMHQDVTGLPKAQDIIIDALSDNKIANECYFIFLGAGSAMSVLQRQADDLGLNATVSFKGIVPNVNDYLSCSDLMVMPSRREGLPIAAIEAACSGLPMIVSDIDSFKEFNTKSVIRCKPGSASSLRESMTIMLSSLNEYKSEAKRSAKCYQNIFSIDNVAKKHIELYNAMLTSNVNN